MMTQTVDDDTFDRIVRLLRNVAYLPNIWGTMLPPSNMEAEELLRRLGMGLYESRPG